MENPLIVLKLGCVDYGRTWRLQQLLVEARRRDELPDILVLTEHPPVITFGQGGGQESLCRSAEDLAAKGVGVYSVERGGQGTFHGPGQVVLYPILKWRPSLLHDLVGDLEQAVINTLNHYNIASDRDPSYPGIWCGEDKIAALGLAFKKGVTSHGIALNVKTDLSFFNLFTPCGIRDKGVTSMQRRLKAQQLDLEEVGSTLVQELATVLNRDYVWGFPEAPWLKVKVPPFQRFSYVWDIIQEEMLNTVCDSASCPNLGECFESGTATFLILGSNCTRRCAYCAVPKGRPQPVDPQEPLRLVRAAARLNLSHLVITSVTRDDLGDGGAGQFADCIVELRRSLPGTTVEVLVPDFRGSTAALQEVISAGPHLFNHNVETVPRLYPNFRPGANYMTSLEVLRYASQHGMRTKSGLMLGLGESRGEVLQVLTDLHNAGCELVTLGQYLRPNAENTPVAEYIHPQEFLWYRDEALRIGFKVVESGPLVRSSYQARESMLKQVT